MRWECLTGPQLLRAREASAGVCLVPIGSLEKHGTHMPTGTDTLTAHALCLAAAERETAVVVPPLYYTHVREMKNNIGAIALDTPVLMQMAEILCDEIARNGFHKIILVNGHGGNRAWLPLMMMDYGDKDKGYAIYMYRDNTMASMSHLRESSVHEGHAGELEASLGLHLFPEYMDMAALAPEPGLPNGLPPVSSYTPVEWVSMYPDAYAGDAQPAKAEKGRILFDEMVHRLADCIRAVKQDEDTLAKMQWFSKAKRSPR
ncbi:MAG: creatininase family protein [Chloroflexi bacterium]|nr:creatininase family protein [Chloroflexota bacterium]